MLWRFLNFSRSISSFFESWDVFGLVFNTLIVFFAVVFSSLIIGLIISIITVRFDFPGSKILFTLCALPLVIPSYIGALTYISAFSPKGLFVQIFNRYGINEIAGIEGFLGSWLVLTLFTYPYVQLICTSALRNLDSTVEDAARSLGVNQFKVYTNVVIPRLKKPIIYSGLLVGLYVISDFGAVSLMRYSTVTKAIYAYYELSILGDPVIFLGLIIPVSVLSFWLIRGIYYGNDVSSSIPGILGSFSAAITTSFFAIIIAMPIVILISQYKSRFGDLLEKIMLSLYGLPHLAVGVSILFISIKLFPTIYQSFFALVISYLIVFLPQAIGGGQASMEQVKSSYIEASLGLGQSKIETFRKITFPLIYRGLFAGGALVFLSTMKELPQTLLLRPTEFSTMAVDVWSFASEALFTQAAFSAFILLAISAIPTYILSTRNLEV